MIRNFLQSFGLAIQNIRSNVFHTFLSVLGIVIGVAALVATFSLIDGLEKFARDKIASQTSFNMLSVATETEKVINDLPVRKDTFEIIDYETYVKIKAATPQVLKANLSTSFNREIQVDGRDSTFGARISCMADQPWGDTILALGRLFSADAFSSKLPEAIVNTRLAKLISGSDDLSSVPGQTVKTFGQSVKIIGVTKDQKADNPPAVYFPISLLSNADLHRSPPSLTLEMARTEEVPVVKGQVENLLKQQFGDRSSDFKLYSQERWIDQTAKGFLIFRIIMGLIIGISVVVGGIGVMNVLLISVTERTAEIGLRKAVGAKKSDIRRLFLAESITVSAFGSMIGLLLGIGFAMIAIPIVRIFAEVPFSPVLTWNTFFIITTVAVLAGIVFGTYPAIKAAKLDPVDALRHE